MDRHGRLADRSVVQSLGWTSGCRLDIQTKGGLIVVAARADGAHDLTGPGHVRLPVHVQRSCGLESGDRLLLAGESADGQLVVHPLAAIDAMISWLHRILLAGGAA